MMRILIVDDHAIVRRGLQQLLESEIGQAQFGEAGTVQDALQQVRQQPWDIVLLDISLPDRNGLGALQDMRCHRPDMPVLVLSMYSEDQYALRALQAGAAGYLCKDSAPEELCKAVQRVLAKGRYVSQDLAEKLAARLIDPDSTGDAPHESLSNREYDVMCMIASGMTVSRIAERLNLSVKTVSTYRTRILTKLNLGNSAEITTYAVRRELV